MKYTHTIINNAVTNPYIDFVNRNFISDEHRFYVIRGWGQEISKIQDFKNVIVINSFKNILNGFRLLFDLSVSDKILIHGLFTPYLIAILFFQPGLLKKANWIIWGGDLTPFNEEEHNLRSNIVEYMRTKVISNFNRITSIKGDYEKANELYKVIASHNRAYYPFAFNTEMIDNLIEKCFAKESESEHTINIVVGNSSSDSNNHFEIFDLIKKYKNENIRIFVPLAYGDKLYAKKVMECGEGIFGKKIIFITDYMPYDEYVKFIYSMNILIFNHERQQGLGNLLLSLYLKKKVYINDKSPLWRFFLNDLELIVERSKEIDNDNYSEFVNVDKIVIEQNSIKVKNLLKEESLVKQWKALFT